MALEDNKTIVRRFLEESAVQGTFEVYDTSFAPGLAVHVYDTPLHSHARMRKLDQQFHQALPGHTLTFHDLIAERGTVAVRYSYAAPLHHSQ